ncbi:hypothetical protein FFLO_06591 [Filobasidium floriforme]|uniref:ACT domain-containing protein n=1 Tax=Filobasidium floriforme TaxID=5210 RepID=A0A8K0JF29_9TREE|nr:hypothetical protein FFLO_06591 [Filobasidium floriforme]
MATFKSALINSATRSMAGRKNALPAAIRWGSSSAPVQSQSEPKAPRPIDDSTSALDYKMTKRRPPTLPVLGGYRSPTAEEAVTNILYNTPAPSLEPYKRHTFNCLVQNEPGVLSRVSGILAARGFNIDSLVVCQTEIRDLSRMCIVLRGQDGVIEQARRQLEDLVPVWAVLDYTKTSTISRELLLAKVSVLGPEYAEQQMSGGPTHSAHSNDAVHDYLPTNEGTEKFQAEQALAQNFESSGGLPPSLSSYNGRQQQGGHQGHALSQSEALIAKNLHLNAIKTLTDQFGGRLVDVAENSVIVELTAKSSRVEAFLSLLRPFGILEAARSGSMVMPRTPIPRNNYDDDEPAEVAALDASLLPPG